MVAYATPAQVRAVLARDSTVPGGTAAELGDEPIQAAIDLAQAVVDARLAGRYSVPWTAPVPPIIVSLTIAMASYQADLTHRQGQQIEASDPSSLRQKWAENFLSLLSTGNADVPQPEVTTDTPSGMTTVNPYYGTLFGTDEFDLSTEGSRSDLLWGSW